MAKKKQDEGGFLFGAFLGGLIGALVALLFAPKSGKELREDLNSTDIKKKTSDWTTQAQSASSELAQKAKGKVVDISNSFVQKNGGSNEENSEQLNQDSNYIPLPNESKDE
ncbi:YtxH domain-containing protein [Bacillus carboniphilus]|uniref:YtxH domain-containing protein n=1 Tax=Bacillus carboniphilus TaxID=86663 RepID=A0ABY9K2S1_9BACI|nr:YtxH domain-containing protein [Bacillus carboniphilus]WLR44206.1 YtxH domain-containing protein [Bacillus carboniphilus]